MHLTYRIAQTILTGWDTQVVQFTAQNSTVLPFLRTMATMTSKQEI